MKDIEILIIGDIDTEMVERVAKKMENFLGIKVKIGFNKENPDYAYSQARGQYLSGEIIKKIVNGGSSRKILGVVNLDLCTPVLTFVFGEAQLDGKAGVVSIYRLKEGSYGEPEIVFERFYKEILHELGHLFGLTHCNLKNCVMHFSANVKQIDLKREQYCEACLDKLKSKLRELR